MDSEHIQSRIKDLERLIDRDATYTIAEHRIGGEQTLALYFIAWKLEEIRACLVTKGIADSIGE